MKIVSLIAIRCNLGNVTSLDFKILYHLMNKFLTSNKQVMVDRKKKIFLSYNSKDRLEFMKVITKASVNNKNPYPLRDFLSYIGYPSSIINKIMKNFKYHYIIKTFGFYNRKKYISKINFLFKKMHFSPSVRLNQKIYSLISTMAKNNIVGPAGINKVKVAGSVKNSDELNIKINNFSPMIGQNNNLLVPSAGQNIQLNNNKIENIPSPLRERSNHINNDRSATTNIGGIKYFLESIFKFNPEVANQFLIYNFNRNNRFSTLPFNTVFKLLTQTFLSMGCFISKPYIQITHIPSTNHQILNDSGIQTRAANNTLLTNSSKVNELIYSWKKKKQESTLDSSSSGLSLANEINYHKKVNIKLFYYVRSENPIFSFLKKLNKSYKKIQRLIMTIFNSDTKLANQTTEKMILFLTQMKANIINEQKKIIKLNILRKYTNQFHFLGDRLATLFNAEVELELIRLRKPYHNSKILVQSLSVESYKTRFIKLISNFYFRIPFKKKWINSTGVTKNNNLALSIGNHDLFNPMIKTLQEIQFLSSDLNSTISPGQGKKSLFLNNKNNYSFSSYLTGINTKLGGRTFKQRIVPRMSQKRLQKGTLSKSKVLYFDRARFLNKTKKGAYTFTVKMGHIF